MWTDEQLNNAKYVVYADWESQQDLNVGTIEISGANNGVYQITPAPPFGSLSNESSSFGGNGSRVGLPMKAMTRAFCPRGRPVPDRTQPDQYIIHDFGNLVP